METIKDFKTGYPSEFTKEEVEKMAQVLTEHLIKTLGGDWYYKTWFNSWECFDVNLGSISVHYSYRTGTFHAYINSRKNEPFGGAGIFKVINDKLPEKAVKEALKYAYEVSKDIMDCIEDNIEKLTKLELK